MNEKPVELAQRKKKEDFFRSSNCSQSIFEVSNSRLCASSEAKLRCFRSTAWSAKGSHLLTDDFIRNSSLTVLHKLANWLRIYTFSHILLLALGKFPPKLSSWTLISEYADEIIGFHT